MRPRKNGMRGSNLARASGPFWVIIYQGAHRHATMPIWISSTFERPSYERPDTPRARMSSTAHVGPSCQLNGGWTPSTAPRDTDWGFDYNAQLTARAETLGFDLAFGLAQWLGADGHGGDMQYRKYSLDPLLVTAGTAALTERIILISTVHALYGWHPLHLAKMGATLDHMTGGRWGLNLVTGFRPHEMGMFGLDSIPHDDRYVMAAEFTDLMQTLWREERNAGLGKVLVAQRSIFSPKPVNSRPIMVSAASSDAGHQYNALQRPDLHHQPG